MSKLKKIREILSYDPNIKYQETKKYDKHYQAPATIKLDYFIAVFVMYS